MGIIRQLAASLVNKIAAGEVVERPASVVKELVENSLDAGATRIVITIEDGGKKLIQVADDGCGIAPDDLALAVSAHATSKLTAEDDLFAIRTLGFRGEALASIGSISHLRLVSRKRDFDQGAEVRVSGTRAEEVRAAGCPPGTTVEVRDLFFNTPARRKFLRTTPTEMGQISEQLTRTALSHPSVAFELVHNGRNVHRLPAGQKVAERISTFFGPELAAELIFIRREEHGLKIEGCAAPPAHSRATGSWQYIFVNGRFIRDRSLQFAVREAYRGLMDHDRHPVIFLFLGVEPEAVDVNVHPTKIEVRWRDGNMVRSQVLSAVRETLRAANLTPMFRAHATVRVDPAEQERAREEMAAWIKGLAPPPSESGGANELPAGSASSSRLSGAWPSFSGQREDGPARLLPASARLQPPPFELRPDAAAHAELLWRSQFAAPQAGAEIPASPPIASNPSSNVPPIVGPARTLQLHNTYLVAETEDGMMIIDQHALHERVIYEELKRRIALGPLESQRLLLPETVRVTPDQIALLEAHEDLLHRLGMEVSPFGTDSVAVQSFPVILKDTDARAVLTDLLDKLSEQPETTHTETVIHAMLDRMACKAAVKAGDPLTPQEIETLIAKRDLVEKSSNCPHGRPTTLRLSIRDLEKQFKRT